MTTKLQTQLKSAHVFEESKKLFAWKVEAGAEFAITQPVFDVEQLEQLEKEELPLPEVSEFKEVTAGEENAQDMD